MRRNGKRRAASIGGSIPSDSALGQCLPACRREYTAFEIFGGSNCKRLIPGSNKGKVVYIKVARFVFLLEEENIKRTVRSDVGGNYIVVEANLGCEEGVIAFPYIFKYHGTIFRYGCGVNFVGIIHTGKAYNSTCRASAGGKAYITGNGNQFLMANDVGISFF
ncbi:hypothetical protein DSECCO2_295410 [anaerobic digester metagenome]